MLSKSLYEINKQQTPENKIKELENTVEVLKQLLINEHQKSWKIIAEMEEIKQENKELQKYKQTSKPSIENSELEQQYQLLIQDHETLMHEMEELKNQNILLNKEKEIGNKYNQSLHQIIKSDNDIYDRVDNSLIIFDEQIKKMMDRMDNLINNSITKK
jgi:hypothetical protein